MIDTKKMTQKELALCESALASMFAFIQTKADRLRDDSEIKQIYKGALEDIREVWDPFKKELEARG